MHLNMRHAISQNNFVLNELCKAAVLSPFSSEVNFGKRHPMMLLVSDVTQDFVRPDKRENTLNELLDIKQTK